MPHPLPVRQIEVKVWRTQSWSKKIIVRKGEHKAAEVRVLEVRK
jgi:hypothetical protein